MKLFLLFTPFIISSCSTYHYMKVKADTPVTNKKNELVYENDALRISYNFYQNNGHVNLSVFNKTATALQVDWTRSVLVIGERAISFVDYQVPITGEVKSTGSTIPDHSFTGEINARAQLPAGMQFIPPNSGIQFKGPSFKAFDLKKIISRQDGDEIKGTDGESGWKKFKDPIHFRIYLSLYPLSEGASPTIIDQSFKITHTRVTGHRIYKGEGPADVIVSSGANKTKNTAILGGVLAAGIIVATID